LLRELLHKRVAELRARIPVGGLREATIRAAIYVGIGRKAVDERAFAMVRRLRPAHANMSLSEFKTLVREQFLILLIDSNAALAALRTMLPADTDLRRQAFGLIEQVMSALGELSSEDKKRMSQVALAFGVEYVARTAPTLTLIPPAARPSAAKAS